LLKYTLTDCFFGDFAHQAESVTLIIIIYHLLGILRMCFLESSGYQSQHTSVSHLLTGVAAPVNDLAVSPI